MTLQLIKFFKKRMFSTPADRVRLKPSGNNFNEARRSRLEHILKTATKFYNLALIENHPEKIVQCAMDTSEDLRGFCFESIAIGLSLPALKFRLTLKSISAVEWSKLGPLHGVAGRM